ncbi:MAG: hypothetical protein ACLQLC_10150 [Candidatus Sulfotelmatobacter sp.]
MNTDLELDVWRQQWQSESAIPSNLREKVERQSRLMRTALICDTLVTVVMGGGATLWAARSSMQGTALVAIATWIFLAAAWAFVLITNRGLWAPSALDATSFLDLSIRRCRGALAATWFAGGLFMSEIAFGLSWAYIHSVAPRPPLFRWLWFGSARIDIVWLCTLTFFAAMVWYRRKKQAELVRLIGLRDEMDLTAVKETAEELQGSPSSAWPFAKRASRLRRKKDIRQT